MKVKSLSQIFVFILFVICLTPCFGRASIMMFDEKLRVKGSLYEFMIYRTSLKEEERQYRDTELGLMRSKATLELLYKTVETEKLDINLFGFFQYWHDSVPDIDDEYRQSIDDPKKYQGPFFDEDDWINELYADIYAGKWNIRLGKQIVVWSEVAMVRTIDQVNSLDLRYTNPGIDPWDEMKLGLWMMRGFYNSNLPGQLVFEWIWVPGDFEQIRTPTEGTSMAGGLVSPPYGETGERPRAFGMKGIADEVMNDARPAFNIRNSQFGFRIRGNSEVFMLNDYYLLDWTVSWWHGMRSTPVVKTDEVASLNTLMGTHALSRLFPGSTSTPQIPDRRMMEYKFYDAIGFSCQSYIPPAKGVLRGEFSYEIGMPINTTSKNGNTYFTGNSERDQMNAGITFDRPVLVPWLQDRGWDVLDCSVGWNSQYKFGDVNRRWETYGFEDRTQSNFTLLIKSRFYHSEFRPVMSFFYNTRNWGYGAFVLAWLPTGHMRYSLGFMWTYAGDPTDSAVASSENGDFLFFKIGYEF